MYWSSPLRGTLNTNAITGLDMFKVCTETVHCVALWTQTLSQVWTCLKYVPKQSIAWHFEHERYHRFGHVKSMYWSSPWRGTLNTNVITGLDMCKVCTEAVHCVALWTQTLSQVWTCLKYVPKQSIAWHFEHERYHRFGHVKSMYRSSPLRIIIVVVIIIIVIIRTWVEQGP